MHLLRSPTYGFLVGAISAQELQTWLQPYLPKGCRPDFNNGLGGDSNSGPVLVHRRLFKSDSNNGPSPGHSSLVSDEVHISVQVSYLWFPGGYNDFSKYTNKLELPSPARESGHVEKIVSLPFSNHKKSWPSPYYLQPSLPDNFWPLPYMCDTWLNFVRHELALLYLTWHGSYK